MWKLWKTVEKSGVKKFSPTPVETVERKNGFSTPSCANGGPCARRQNGAFPPFHRPYYQKTTKKFFLSLKNEEVFP